MVGHVASALDLDHLDVTGREHVAQRLLGPTQRDHVGVLDEQHPIVAGPGLARLDEGELRGPRGAVRALAEILDVERGGHRSGSSTFWA
jgi:hypothetical protein